MENGVDTNFRKEKNNLALSSTYETSSSHKLLSDSLNSNVIDRCSGNNTVSFDEISTSTKPDCSHPLHLSNDPILIERRIELKKAEASAAIRSDSCFNENTNSDISPCFHETHVAPNAEVKTPISQCFEYSPHNEHTSSYNSPQPLKNHSDYHLYHENNTGRQRDRLFLFKKSSENKNDSELISHSQSTIISDWDPEWTEQDSGYGAACPVCGWLPKSVRKAIEFTLIGTFVLATVLFIVSTSVRIEGSNNSEYSNSEIIDNQWDDDYYGSQVYDDDQYMLYNSTDDATDDYNL